MAFEAFLWLQRCDSVAALDDTNDVDKDDDVLYRLSNCL